MWNFRATPGRVRERQSSRCVASRGETFFFVLRDNYRDFQSSAMTAVAIKLRMDPVWTVWTIKLPDEPPDARI